MITKLSHFLWYFEISSFHIKSCIYLEFTLDKTGIPLFFHGHLGTLAFTKSTFTPQKSRPQQELTCGKYLSLCDTTVITENPEPT